MKNDLTNLIINYRYYKANGLNVPYVMLERIFCYMLDEYNEEFPPWSNNAPNFYLWMTKRLG